ncbi:MAG: glycoside hydrolase/phage tail family protein, partial [Gemmobacter sp.]
SFPFVDGLRQLAGAVRAILGPGCKISYAADWSEYFGYQTPEGDLRFHLDPFWADADVDFIGIDNYMPLSDWREGEDHADLAVARSIYDPVYLRGNVAGGEGFDWFYASEEGRAAQIRTPITDGAYGEPWVFRYKDLRGWWENAHHDRVGGVRAAAPTAWVPQSKPFWFTEYGCPAIDKGTNQPNVFLDPKSSESFAPRHSTGRRDDAIQLAYLTAVDAHWRDPAANPLSEAYGAPMVDMTRAFVWAWDARPFPAFPGNAALWVDAANWGRGHWISGRAASQPLAAVVADICAAGGVAADVSGLHGIVRGYARAEVGTARAALQPLMLAYGFDALERDGALRFRMRDGRADSRLTRDDLAEHPEAEGDTERLRAGEAEISGRVRLGFVEAEADFAARSEEAVFPGDSAAAVSANDLPLVLTRAEARGITERWLAEARVARDGLRLALPPSGRGIGAGDVVDLAGAGRFRIDRVEAAGVRLCEGVRIDPGVYP